LNLKSRDCSSFGVSQVQDSRLGWVMNDAAIQCRTNCQIICLPIFFSDTEDSIDISAAVCLLMPNTNATRNLAHCQEGILLLTANADTFYDTFESRYMRDPWNCYQYFTWN
jgi:hypothetical protein